MIEEISDAALKTGGDYSEKMCEYSKMYRLVADDSYSVSNHFICKWCWG